MILQELLEASTFRKKSTSQMTYGFEFEIMVDDTEKENIENIIKRLKKEYPFEKYVERKIKFSNLSQLKPKYGYVSKKDFVKYKIQENPEEAKLVQEILKLKDLKKQYFYLKMLVNYNIPKIDNVSDFDDYLINNHQINIADKKLNKNIKKRDIKNSIELYLYNFFPYDSNNINNVLLEEYIYDKDSNVIKIRNITSLNSIKELFENYDKILNNFEEDYNQFIYDESENLLEKNKIALKYVENLLQKNNITNVKVLSDESIGENGVEIITNKIHGLDEAISQFNKISHFIQNEESLYTNSHTGLHVNIGTWKDISQLDLTKLLIFSNEIKILSKMKREQNDYTKSLVKKLVSYLQKQEKFQNYNEIIKNINKEFLITANHTSFMDFTKLKNSGYIEIRGFGNEDYEYKNDYIIKMIRYLSRIMEIASDPEDAKQQYIKKLYKVFNLENDLSGEKKEETIINNPFITHKELSSILRFFPNNIKKSFKEKLQNPIENSSFVLNNFILYLMIYDKDLLNSDLKILYKILKNINITKEYYEDKIKGKSDKIDNLFKNYLLKGKV